MNRIHFSRDPHPMRYAAIASFDLSGFSRFCLRPDAHAHLSFYLSQVFDVFDNSFEAFFRDLFKDSSTLVQVSRPTFTKFTGDGAILFWVKDTADAFSEDFCTSLVAALRHFQQQLPGLVSEWERTCPITDLPKQARVGIAIGPVYPLATEGPTFFPEIADYAGYHINLAVRLQDHCPAIGFIIHEAVHPKLRDLTKLRALNIKGSAETPVYVFSDDFKRALAADPGAIRDKFST